MPVERNNNYIFQVSFCCITLFVHEGCIHVLYTPLFSLSLRIERRTAHVLSVLDPDVAVLAPVSAPRVADQPVGYNSLSGWLHDMVMFLRIIIAHVLRVCVCVCVCVCVLIYIPVRS